MGGGLRKFILIVVCAIFSVTAIPAVAAGGKKSSSSSGSSGGSSSSDIKSANNQVGFQSISTNVNYTEIGNGVQTVPAGTLDTEMGAVPGTAYYLSVMNDLLLGNDYFKATYDQSSGQTNYVGQSLQGGTGYGSIVSTSGATLTNYSARYGKGFAARGNSMLTPFIEVGSHTWVRGVNYGETYSNNYFGVGLLSQYSLGNRLVFSVDLMSGHTSQSAIVVASGPQVTGFSAALGDSDLYKVGLSLDYAVGPRIHLNAGVDYSSFSYGISATQPGGLLEPDSKTTYTTVRFGLGFGF
jgi:hypothetical protein